MRVEDISALKYCQNLMRASRDYVIYYKPHPLIIKNVDNHLRKSIGKTSINVIQDLKYQLFDIILSPLSSTSSILIQPNQDYKIYIYKNPKFHCPDPLEQFDIQLKKVSFTNEYCIQEKFYSNISIQNMQKHIRLFS